VLKALLVAMVALSLASLGSSACGGGDGTPPPQDGTIVGTEGGMHGGRLWFIWNGHKQRIEMPRALETSWLPQMGLSIGEPAPEMLTLAADAARASEFLVMPPSGDEVKRYLAYEGELHEVKIVQADVSDVEKLPDAEDRLILRVPLPE
jgi:hypothetical protein